jgi:hypothetical protein
MLMSKQDARWLIGRAVVIAALLVMFFALTGCSGRPARIPVSDPDLKKSSAEFAADAAKRSYPAEAPRGGEATARADVDHGVLNRMKLINLSDHDWADVDLWVNQKYVVHLGHWPRGQLKKINFQMLYDGDGKSFPISNDANGQKVETVELAREGKVFDVPVTLAD